MFTSPYKNKIVFKKANWNFCQCNKLQQITISGSSCLEHPTNLCTSAIAATLLYVKPAPLGFYS